MYFCYKIQTFIAVLPFNFTVGLHFFVGFKHFININLLHLKNYLRTISNCKYLDLIFYFFYLLLKLISELPRSEFDQGPVLRNHKLCFDKQE